MGSMRPIVSTISIDEARAQVQAVARPIARTERVALADAHGRVAAADVIADRDVPAFDRSAMDGYAVIAADTAQASEERPVRLRLRDRLYAGDNARLAVEPGTCVEVATGAPLPAGADAVVMVEDTRVSAEAPDAISVLASVNAGQHTVSRASDMREGDLVIARGTELNASRIGALAAIGAGDVDVFAKPLVAILPTGNELVEPGRPLPPGHVYEVNRFTLAALVRQHGGIARVHPPAADTLDDLRRAIDDALAGHAHAARTVTPTAITTAPAGSPSSQAGDDAHEDEPVDVLVLSGGSSVGERDLVLDVLRERGEVFFHGLAVKPGKPTGLARIGRTLVFAMPGNPTSCLSNAHVLLVPLLRLIARLPRYDAPTRRLPLADAVSSPAGKHQFLPVRIADGYAEPTFKGSGEITSLSRADGYVEIPADVERLDRDTLVTVILY